MGQAYTYPPLGLSAAPLSDHTVHLEGNFSFPSGGMPRVGGVFDGRRKVEKGRQSVEAGRTEEWRMIAVISFTPSGCCDTYNE